MELVSWKEVVNMMLPIKGNSIHRRFWSAHRITVDDLLQTGNLFQCI